MIMNQVLGSGLRAVLMVFLEEAVPRISSLVGARAPQETLRKLGEWQQIELLQVDSRCPFHPNCILQQVRNPAPPSSVCMHL